MPSNLAIYSDIHKRIFVDIKQLQDFTKELSLIYVEDNAHVRKVHKEVFDEFFNVVDVAGNGQVGLDMYMNNGYDLVISDINLPKMNGLQMISEIVKVNPDQPVIVMSAYSEVEYMSTLQSLNVRFFLKKPVETKRLLTTICQSVGLLANDKCKMENCIKKEECALYADRLAYAD